MSVGTCPQCGALRKELRNVRGSLKCARCIRVAKCKIPHLKAMRERGKWN